MLFRNFSCATLLAAIVISASGCNYASKALGLPQKTKFGSPELVVFNSMYRVDRNARCLSQLPQNPEDLRLDISSPSRAQRVKYDAMLHIYNYGTSTTISFSKKGSEFMWTGEQEIHQGPRIIETEDGPQHEDIMINSEDVSVSGFPVGTTIRYTYPDSDGHLSFKDLPCQEARAIIGRWLSSKK